MRASSARRAFGMSLLLATGALAFACGGGTAAEKPAASTGSSSSGSAGASAPTAGEGKVSVTLAEWSVKPATATVKGGKVSMKVTNGGATPHELVVVKTDVAQDKLEKANGIADEAKYKPLVRTKQLNGSESTELEVDLSPGKYVLLCNVSGHYDLGMHTAFTVN